MTLVALAHDAAAQAPEAPRVVPVPAPIEAPELPDVADPLLAPPAPARHTLTSWRSALELVRRTSTDLERASARVERARGESRQALAAILPALSGFGEVGTHLLTGERLTASGSRTTVPDPRASVAAGLQLTVPLFHPASFHARGAREQAVRVRMLDAEEAERRVVAGLADAVLSVATAERLSEVSRVFLRSALATSELTKRRAMLGASTAIDVLRAAQEVESARADVVATDEALFSARDGLGLALGSSESYGVATTLRLDEGSSGSFGEGCRKYASLAERPDLKAANAELDLAEREKDVVNGSFWPTLDAVSDLTVYGAESDLNDRHVVWTAGARLSWLLFDGGARYGARSAAAAAVREVRAQSEEARRRAETSLAQLARRVQVAERNLAVSARAREIAVETARLAKVSYMNGSGTSFDLIDTARRQRQSELDLAVREFDVIRARVAAFLALASCRP
jgi:outer membrane protein TolC